MPPVGFFPARDFARAEPGLMVWIGPEFFSGALPLHGWEVVRADHDLERLRGWPDVVALAGGREPRVVVAADCSAPPLVTGVERFPCLTVFYAVDSHVHSWHPLYAQAFDLCLVSLKDHLSLFSRGRLGTRDVLWSPAFARDDIRPPEHLPAREFDLLFVGTADPGRTPERFRFLEELKAVYPGLHVTRGNFPSLFPRAKLLLNECAAGDLNFRVFEALGCGGCLLTPRIGHGLDELFADRRELFLYEQHNVASLLPLLEELGDNEALCREVAVRGLAAVDAGHRASHRAARFAAALGERLGSDGAKARIAARLRQAPAIHREFLRALYLHHAEAADAQALRLGYLRAARQTACTTRPA